MRGRTRGLERLLLGSSAEVPLDDGEQRSARERVSPERMRGRLVSFVVMLSCWGLLVTKFWFVVVLFDFLRSYVTNYCLLTLNALQRQRQRMRGRIVVFPQDARRGGVRLRRPGGGRHDRLLSRPYAGGE